MYHYAGRLLDDAGSGSARVLRAHTNALLASANALRMARPWQRWFAVVAGAVPSPVETSERVRGVAMCMGIPGARAAQTD
jgi:uncharacterized membrane protein (DUF2068 family)